VRTRKDPRTHARSLTDGRMSAMRVTLETSYRQMLLAPFDDHPVIPVDDTTLGVVGPDGRALNISLGIRDGRVRVDITTDPDAELEGGFEDEEEFVLDLDGELWLSGWDDAHAVFTPERPGAHHVRVRARGRRDHPDESVVKKKPVEFYQLAIWPVA
jgi:hypothetical protein